MKKLIKVIALLSLIASAMPSYGVDITLSPVYTAVDLVRSALVTVVSPFASTGATTVEAANARIEMKAVQDDARAYLAGDNMSENLAEVIATVEEAAVEKGMDELVGNPERVALEIINL